MSSTGRINIAFSKKVNENKIGNCFLVIGMILLAFMFQGCQQPINEGQLQIGWAIEDITPQGQVELKGQYYTRISEYVQSPLKATGLAIESTDENGKKQQAIMLSIDISSLVSGGIQDSLKVLIKEKLPDFDVNNLLLNTIHTHTSFYPSQHREMLFEKLAKVAVDAWNNRKPGGISRELRYAVVGHNRRVVYADGSTEMYGSCDRKDFIGLEGPEDSSVKMIYCWDLNKNLTGIILNVACPAQICEGKYFISSDYVGEVRKRINKEYPDAFLLTQIGAAGDIAPRDLPKGYRDEEPNMWDVSGVEEIGKRLITVINEAYPDAKNNIETTPGFKHLVKNIEIPARQYTQEECETAQAIVDEILLREPKDPNSGETAWNRFLAELKENEKTKKYGPWDNKVSDFGLLKKQQALVEQYKEQDSHPFYPVELHTIQLGDAVFVCNPFELYLDFGLRIEARSNANETFIIQLCSGDYGGYLPTQRAINGTAYKGYSAMATKVGPEGGQGLVNESVKEINKLFPTK